MFYVTLIVWIGIAAMPSGRRIYNARDERLHATELKVSDSKIYKLAEQFDTDWKRWMREFYVDLLIQLRNYITIYTLNQ